MNKETRTFQVSELRVEQAEGEPAKIRGHAAVFNELSLDLGGFREKIEPGAFTDAIGGSDIRALFNHDANFVLGRNKSNTLQVWEDERGLAVEITPPDSQTIRDLVIEPMARGDISQMSFGFSVLDDSWESEDGENIRTIRTVGELFDVSPVTFPAYPSTDVALRSAPQEIRNSIEGVEDTEPEPEVDEPAENLPTAADLKKRLELVSSGA